MVAMAAVVWAFGCGEVLMPAWFGEVAAAWVTVWALVAVQRHLRHLAMVSYTYLPIEAVSATTRMAPTSADATAYKSPNPACLGAAAATLGTPLARVTDEAAPQAALHVSCPVSKQGA